MFCTGTVCAEIVLTETTGRETNLVLGSLVQTILSIASCSKDPNGRFFFNPRCSDIADLPSRQIVYILTIDM